MKGLFIVTGAVVSVHYIVGFILIVLMYYKIWKVIKKIRRECSKSSTNSTIINA